MCVRDHPGPDIEWEGGGGGGPHQNWRSDPTSGLPFSKGKTMAKRLGMMPGCIKYYFLCHFQSQDPIDPLKNQEITTI